MDLESIVLSEKVRQRKTLCDFTYMWNLKKQMNRPNRNGLTESKLAVARGERSEGLGEIHKAD